MTVFERVRMLESAHALARRGDVAHSEPLSPAELFCAVARQ
jgi:hypothetical protein